jgi:hypothetical protein
MANPFEDPLPEHVGAAEEAAVPGLNGGMSWCWELDFAALVDAVTGAAPWLRADDRGGSAAEADADAHAEAGADADADARADADADARADADAGAAATDTESTIVDPEAEQAAYLEALDAGRVGTMPVGVVAGRVAESLPTGPGLAGWLALAPAAELEDGALAGVAASFRRLASWAAAGELAAVAQIASRSARSDRRAAVDQSGRPDRVTGDAAGQVALALALSPDGAAGWVDLAVALTWRLHATAAALATGEIDLTRAKMIARLTGPLDDAKARQVEAAVLGRAGWQTPGQLHAALRRAVLKADPQGADKRREQAERNAKVALYPEDEGTASLAGYCLPGVQAAAAMARITALARALQAAGAGGAGRKIDLVRAQVFLGLLLGTLPYIPPAPGGPPDQPAGDEPGDEPGSGGGPPPGNLPDPPGELPDAPDDPIDDLPPDDLPDELPEDYPDEPLRDEPAAQDELHGASAAGDEPVAGTGAWWPGVLPCLPAGPGTLGGVQPLAKPGGAGLLSLAVPLRTLTGGSAAPGRLSRLGVIGAAQARQLAELAAGHPGTRWQIILTNPGGEAIAVTALPRSRSPGPEVAADDGGVGLVGQVRLIIRTDQLEPDPGAARHGLSPPGSPIAMIVGRAVAAAGRAWAAAAERCLRDAAAGRCAHGLASAAYRPPPRIAALVTARDQTCRFGPCRRPASQCDLDHDVPYDQGGLTCPCNLGGKCRQHHQLKQHPRWMVTQPNPGTFRWTTPAGRTYTTRPDVYVT